MWWLWQDLNLGPWDYDFPTIARIRLISSIFEKGIKKNLFF